MQSPQRMQRSRKCDSSSEPGGRMRKVPAGVFRPGPDRISGTITAPAAMLVMSARRFSSGVSRVCFAGDGVVDHVKLMPPVGQSVTQFMQRWHSALRQAAPGTGSSPPWQWSRQRRQSSHFSSCLRICTSDQREQTPSSAPSGQMARHQKRVTPCVEDQHEDEQAADQERPVEVRLLEAEDRRVQDDARAVDDRLRRTERPAVGGVEARADGGVDRRQRPRSTSTAPGTTAGRAAGRPPTRTAPSRAPRRAGGTSPPATSCSGSTR